MSDEAGTLDGAADARVADRGDGGAAWPVEFRGVTESVVATIGPNDRWNVAALGLHPPDADRSGTTATDDESPTSGDGPAADAPVTARTFGNTRTRRNFRREGGGVVQFTRDPVDFVDAALSLFEVDDPVLPSADAWVEVDAESVGVDESSDTRIETWELRPRAAGVERETVPTTNRGFAAVVEATVAASRLDVDAYDESELRERLAYFEDLGRRCGGDRVRAAFDRLVDHIDG